MTEAAWTVLAWGIALVINLVPAFMPPTWAVLAVFRVTTGVPLLPLTIGGAAASAIGRAGLALGSARLGQYLPQSDRANARAIGEFVERHERWGLVIVFFGCLGPLPSNAIFIAAGLGKIRLRWLVATSFASRAIADTFWVWTANVVAANFKDLLNEQLHSWMGIAVQIASILLVVAVFRLPWARWLHFEPGKEREERGTPRHRPKTA